MDTRTTTSTLMICWEIDWRSPCDAFAPLAGEAHAHLLHAGDKAQHQWSTIAAFPSDIYTLTASEDVSRWRAEIDYLIKKRVMNGHRPTSAPFHSGLIGFVGYEAFQFDETTLGLPHSPYRLPLAAFGVYDAVAVFNRKDSRSFVVGCDEIACHRLKSALGICAAPKNAIVSFSPPTSNFTQASYEAAILDILERIARGDFYQANIAQTFSVTSDRKFSAFDIFKILASQSDARFAALLQFDEGAIISNSPERFFRLSKSEPESRRIVTEPIKGTRSRGADPISDATLAEELCNSAKDRAENIMIADLMRNDLSKICTDGSVSEDAICELMSLSSVHHLVSRISGDLRENITIMDVFRALFPSGSITGAPKIEAMRAIAEIEQIGRGPYCGAIGYIDDHGGADFSVAIRTLIAENEFATLRIPVGGGITLRSDPADEYEETLLKAAGALNALS